MLSYLSEIGSIEKLIWFLMTEEFETESIEMDVNEELNGNIGHVVDNKKVMDALCNFVRQNKCMLSIHLIYMLHVHKHIIYTVKSSSFQIGFTFYYWPHYKNMKVFEHMKDSDNINHHSGFSPSELYITPKYSTFKEEFETILFLLLNHISK